MANNETLAHSSSITIIKEISTNKYEAKLADPNIDASYTFTINPLSNQLVLNFIVNHSSQHRGKGIAQALLLDLILRAKVAGYYEVVLYTQNVLMHKVVQKALAQHMGHIKFVDDEGSLRPYTARVGGQVEIIIDIREIDQIELERLLEEKTLPLTKAHTLYHSIP